jgi:hypothetical protein
MTAGDLLRGTLGLLWHALRLPAYMFLAILEPVVSFVLWALALLGVLTALFLKFYGVPYMLTLLCESVCDRKHCICAVSGFYKAALRDPSIISVRQVHLAQERAITRVSFEVLQ